jgi:hypothetical protein
LDTKGNYIDLPNGACLKRNFKKYNLVKIHNNEHKPNAGFFEKMVQNGYPETVCLYDTRGNDLTRSFPQKVKFTVINA